MATGRRSDEERLLKAILPWLSRQLGDELKWLGRPEDPGYVSRCEEARSSRSPVDAEVTGDRRRVALEHTTLDSFPEQRTFGALFAKLRQEVRLLTPLVPAGNSVTVGVLLSSISETLTENRVSKVTPCIKQRLCEYLQGIPANPTRHDVVRGDLLDEPEQWDYNGFSIKVCRFWLSTGRRISLVSLVDGVRWEQGVRQCLERALCAKLGTRKAKSYEAYRKAGWFVGLILEISDFQLSGVDIAGNAFGPSAQGLRLDCVDGVALVQQLDDSTLECCWAYREGQVRTWRERHVEMCECLGIPPNE
jgi:hypothetical protein